MMDNQTHLAVLGEQMKTLRVQGEGVVDRVRADLAKHESERKAAIDGVRVRAAKQERKRAKRERKQAKRERKQAGAINALRLELAKRETERIEREAQRDAERAKWEAELDAKLAAREAERAKREAVRDAEFAAREAQRDAEFAAREAERAKREAERDAQLAKRDAERDTAFAKLSANLLGALDGMRVDMARQSEATTKLIVWGMLGLAGFIAAVVTISRIL